MLRHLSEIGVNPIPQLKHNPFLTPITPTKKEEPITIKQVDYRNQKVTEAKIPGKNSNAFFIGIITTLCVVIAVGVFK